MKKTHDYPKQRRRWTKEEDDFLRQHYGMMTAKELAAALNHPFSSTQSHILELGLKKDPAFYADPKRSGRLYSGSPKAYSGKNRSPAGAERIDAFGYVMVRVDHTEDRQRNWVPKHHLVWQQHTGALPPEGHVLIFKDGNKRNFDVSNLELISRGEHCFRNSFYKLPENLQLLLRLKGTITRRLNHVRFKQEA